MNAFVLRKAAFITSMEYATGQEQTKETLTVRAINGQIRNYQVTYGNHHERRQSADHTKAPRPSARELPSCVKVRRLGWNGILAAGD